MLKKDDIQSLQALLRKGQLFTDPASLFAYEVDAGLDRGIPEGVVLPHSTADVVQVVRWAAGHHVPLIGRGAGTGLSGGAVAEHGGLIVEFSRMNHVLEIDERGRSAVVEPGLINLHFDEQVRAKGLYFPPDPASQRASTIGGNVAENSGGPHCFKYGVTTNYVTGMEVVLADGRLVRVGGQAHDYPEYDWCGLITGSEGMLALMTAISVRLVRNPPGVKTMLAVFDSVEQAGVGVSAVIAAGLVPATMEMMDQKIIRIVEEYVHAGLPTEAQAMLIVEVDGYPESLDAQVDEIARILRAQGAYNLRIASSPEERNQIWLARKSAAGAITRLTPSYYTVDVTVPRSRLAETLAEVNEICDRYRLRVGYVFHAGDGNLHPLILVPDTQDKDLMERVHHAGREIVELTVRKDGSISGEHGIGIEKRAFMPLMFNAAELSAMLDIKHVFDPNNLFNPGKMFPAALDSPAAGNHEGRPYSVAPNKDLPPDTNLFTPTTPQEAAQLLVALAKAGRRVHIRGNPIRKDHPLGRPDTLHPPTHDHPADTLDAILCTSSLRGIKTYAPDDLYITVGTGTPFSEIQSFLAPDSKHVPLASPWPEATIGGLVAANVNAPLRMRYGAIRDLVLCATVALADGRLIRAGRPVIKNVAGFDLAKLFIGSHGTLGLLADITLKLSVLPRAQRTLFIPASDLRHGLIWARQLYPLSLVASAILLCHNCPLPGIPESPYTLVYTAEGLAGDVQAELDQVRQVLRAAGGPEPIEVPGITGTALWANLLGSSSDSLQMRLGVPIKDLPVYVQDQAAALNAGPFIADIGSGFVYAILPPQIDEASDASAWINTLRQPALAYGGYAIVTQLPEGWPGAPDRWGYQPETLDLMRKLKARWDPRGILNPGEFVL